MPDEDPELAAAMWDDLSPPPAPLPTLAYLGQAMADAEVERARVECDLARATDMLRIAKVRTMLARRAWGEAVARELEE